MGSSTYMGGSHLDFHKLPLRKGAKLHRYKIVNNKTFQKIGILHWRGGWRQYVFQALPEVDMSRSCHKEIDKFIDKLMKEWREGKQKRKNDQ